MTGPLDGTIGGLLGRLDVLRIECFECDRFGRYPVAQLVEQFGPDYRLMDWLQERTRDCQHRNQPGAMRPCGAIMPDLGALR